MLGNPGLDTGVLDPDPVEHPSTDGRQPRRGWPGQGSALTDLATAAPNASGAPTFTQSSTAPTVPDAAINGVRRVTGPSWVVRSIWL